MIVRVWICVFAASVAAGACAGKSQPPVPPLPTQLAGAKNISREDGLALLETNIEQPPNRPEMPVDLAARPGMALFGLYMICVRENGQVGALRIVKPAAWDDADDTWIGQIRNWHYKPYIRDGQARPFCYPHAIQVRS